MKIVIWTGPAWETWGPASLDTGIGGSETAALHVSAGLAALGHEVEVVGQVVPGRWRGVGFTSVGEPRPGELLRDDELALPGEVECDVFVSSRQLGAASLLGSRLRARRKVLWAHDVHVGADPRGLLGGYDEVFCLSRWAAETFRKHYPGLDPSKIFLTRNGVDLELFGISPDPARRREPSKTGFSVVYSSSPDRGLDKLLDYWPEVRKLRPEAALSVCYGFDTWQKMAERRGDRTGLLVIQLLRERLRRMADQGVTLLGRVGQRDLVDLQMGASAWLYPTDFRETSCITAMEALAAGCDAVTTRLAALEETVGSHGHLVEPPNMLSRYREDFMSIVRGIARSPRDDRGMTDVGWTVRNHRAMAPDWYSWAGVARQWDVHFREVLR